MELGWSKEVGEGGKGSWGGVRKLGRGREGVRELGRGRLGKGVELGRREGEGGVFGVREFGVELGRGVKGVRDLKGGGRYLGRRKVGVSWGIRE